MRRDKRQECQDEASFREQRSSLPAANRERNRDQPPASGSHSSGGIKVYQSFQVEDKAAVKSEFDLNYDERRRLRTNLARLSNRQKEQMYEVINDQLDESNFKSTNLKDIIGYRVFARTKKE